MARKKNDFWDNVDNEHVVSYDSPEGEGAAAAEDDWSIFKSTPIKVIMRLLLMASCLAALVSGYVAYQYIQDRYAGGSYSEDFYESRSFAKEYNKSVEKLTGLLKAVEADDELTNSGNEELLATMVENNMGKDTNFAFLIQDPEHYAIASSGDDAKDRIEASSHYALITNTEGELSVKSSVPASLLDVDSWKELFGDVKDKYIIYTAVDDELKYQDSYQSARANFEKMAEYFDLAKIAGIVSLIIFILCLIFCIISTGQVRGYDGIELSLFDRVFTELALVIMIAVGGALIYGARRFLGMDRTIYRIVGVGLIVLSYGWIARCYFSIVRRIKTGRLFRCSIVGTIVRGIAATLGKLPYPFSAIFQGLLLILANAAVVYLVIRYKDVTFYGFRVAYFLAGAAAVIELVGLLSYATGSADAAASDYEETVPDSGDALEEISAEINAQKEGDESDAGMSFSQADDVIPPVIGMEEEQDWETMDLSSVIASAEKEKRESMEAGENSYGPETEVISDADMETVLKESGLDKVDGGHVDLVKLNKDIRKSYRPALKERGISVAMRSPEKPVVIDIDESSLSVMINNIFEQIQRFSADNVKNYIESYVQGDKVVYMAKINVAEDMKEAAMAADSDGSFDDARGIVEANGGRFVVSCEDDMLRVGMLMDAAE